MRPWRVLGMLGMLAGATLSISCDQTPSPPKAIRDASKEPATQQAARPTTQELLSGSFRKYMLPDTPLSVQAPESWRFTSAGSVRLLEGPSPADQAMITYTQRDPVQEDRVEGLISRLKGEVSSNGDIFKSELRQIGQMRVLERLTTSPPVTNPKLDNRGNPLFDAQNNPVTVKTTAVEWSLIAFIPEGKLWKQYVLTVIGLTTDSYGTDRVLLERILGSLMQESGPTTQAK